MSKKKQQEKISGVPSSADLHKQVHVVIGSETLADLEATIGAGKDLHQGLVVAEGLTSTILAKLDQAITVIETCKKIPDFNTDLSIAMALRTARLKVLSYDPRVDDVHLASEEVEPTSIGSDSCMREGLNIKYIPVVLPTKVDFDLGWNA